MLVLEIWVDYIRIKDITKGMATIPDFAQCVPTHPTPHPLLLLSYVPLPSLCHL